MNLVQVDWLTLVLAPVVVISLGLAFYTARQKWARSEDGARLPRWGRVTRSVGILSAMFLGFIQLMWNGGAFNCAEPSSGCAVSTPPHDHDSKQALAQFDVEPSVL